MARFAFPAALSTRLRHAAPAVLLVGLGARRLRRPPVNARSDRLAPTPTGSGSGGAAHLRRDTRAALCAKTPRTRSPPCTMRRRCAGWGQHAQAVAVLQGLAVKNPRDMPVLAAYGKALADAGRLQEAANVLERAHTTRPARAGACSPRQGSVADQMGRSRGGAELLLRGAQDQAERARRALQSRSLLCARAQDAAGRGDAEACHPRSRQQTRASARTSRSCSRSKASTPMPKPSRDATIRRSTRPRTWRS